jgi:hypothetical protein
MALAAAWFVVSFLKFVFDAQLVFEQFGSPQPSVS